MNKSGVIIYVTRDKKRTWCVYVRGVPHPLFETQTLCKLSNILGHLICGDSGRVGVDITMVYR